MTDAVGGRAAFQVLVLPYRPTGHGTQYALFRRADAACWQGVAGGGEAGESPLRAARREAAEEAGLVGEREFVPLDARATIPVVHVTGSSPGGRGAGDPGVRVRCPSGGRRGDVVGRAHRVRLVRSRRRGEGRAVGFEPHRPVGAGSSATPRHRLPRRLRGHPDSPRQAVLVRKAVIASGPGW
ncbi:NUDIX domain-containing protein [Frankia sp. CH37]|nr:NUDIX domain-containing protein [Parafrankia sp. CH37]